MENSQYLRLMRTFVESSVDYRVINHPPEGNTKRASELRHHPSRSAAKCMFMQVKGRMIDRYAMAVIPGDRRVDFRKLKKEFNATDVRLADRATAERMSGCTSGCLIPFSFDEAFSIVFDLALLEPPEVYFNAACLDRSIAVNPHDLVALSRPRLAEISRTENDVNEETPRVLAGTET
jgi:Ala-tRNA(Pro) deacylase